jgi:hypothetical protein
MESSTGFNDKDILNRNQNDETLPNVIKRKHPKKEREKRIKRQGPKSRQARAQTRPATRRRGNH